jgi:beta-1,4-N-acetylglucosaminyltransferase
MPGGSSEMIFVTVGSVAPFDELIMKVDEMAEKGIVDGMIAQIGNGGYEPRNGRWYRFKESLMEDYKASNLIITHTGAGTLFEIVELGKKAIAVPNPHVVMNHDIAERLSKDGHIIWCPDLAQLGGKIEGMATWNPRRYEETQCKIPDMIVEFLGAHK